MKLPNIPNNIIVRDRVVVKTRDHELHVFNLVQDGNSLSADLGEYGVYRESLEYDGEKIFGNISLQVKTDQSFVVQCPFRIKKTNTVPYFMIPGFMYGSNNLAKSDGTQPKFNYGGRVGFPNSSRFYTRADRSTHSGVLMIKDGTVFLASIDEVLQGHTVRTDDPWAAGHLYNGLILDSSNPEFDEIGFMLGYEHAPQRYSWVWDRPKTPGNTEYLWGGIKNCAGLTLTARSFYYIDHAAGITDHGKAIRARYYHLHEGPVKRATRKEALVKLSNMMVEHGYNAQDKYFYQNSSAEGRLMGDIAWTGGFQVAYPLLKSGLLLNNEQAVAICIEYMDHVCKTAVNENAGLLCEEFYDGNWNITGWWGRRVDSMNFGDQPKHSAYLNGQAAYFLLRMSQLLKHQNPLWLRTAQMVIDTAIKGQNAEGSYPSLFNPEDGSAYSYDGFQSCWFTSGAIVLASITGNKGYLNSAKRALDYYHTWHEKGEIYGTPMDTHNAVDEEGNLSFIIACVEMHKVTGERKYLDYAMDGLNWEFTWKFAYNTAHSNEPLRGMNWSSCGGSITSTFITTIHQMGNLISGEMYYLYRQLEDPYITDRLKDTCIWGLGTFNRFDNEFGFGTTGMATEQFFYSDGLCCPWNRPWDGGVWEENLPWAAACVLLSCAEDIPDSFFGE